MAFSGVVRTIKKSGRQILQGSHIGRTPWQMFAVRSMSTPDSFKYSELQIERAEVLKPKPDLSNIIFGRNMTDHMLIVSWANTDGWSTPRITPFRNLSLHPGCSVFHYGICLFEGLKAYMGEDGRIRIFRPNLNMKRMKDTAERAALPKPDGEELMRCIAKLIHVDRDWVPDSRTSSLYIRPTIIGTEPAVGLYYPNHALLYCILSPVGSYFGARKFNPVTLYADTDHVRAWHGGAGYVKMGSNYAPTIKPQRMAEDKGCQQILWLYGDEHYLTEVGTMNIMIYWINQDGEKELLTPCLDGTILPGVTRQSLLDLAREWDEFKVTERKVTMAEFCKAIKEKRVIEVFGAGTACVVSPVGKVLYRGEMMEIPTEDSEVQLYRRFYDTLMDIQYGRLPHKWAVDIDEIIEQEMRGETISNIAS